MPGDPSPPENNNPDEGIPPHPSLMRWMDVAKTRVRFPDAASLEAPEDSGDRPVADQAKRAESFRRWHGRPKDALGPI